TTGAPVDGNPYANLLPNSPAGGQPAYQPTFPAYTPPMYSADSAPRTALAPQGDTYPSPSDRAVVPDVPEVPSVPNATPPAEPAGQPVDELMMYDDPSWYNPTSWFAGPTWENSVEFGLNGSDGNSETISVRAGANAKRKTEHSTLNLEARYNKASTAGVETQNNALGQLRYEWLLGDSPWSMFVNSTLEYDEFRSFDARVAVNGGVGYRIIDRESTTLTGRFGSGVSHEINGVDDDYVPEAVFGLDFEHQLSKRQKIVAKTDYYPQWDAFEDYRLLSDIGWEILLNEAGNLSMKVALTDRYDSTPDGLKPNDINYSLLLLWKL
ncbi:MAG: DUF481 domain-containing protein, partial [Planctomycetales bacterium]|nr:DUF481 domain-containing protein [Planctomycetales bacterium]